jgi:hypothetical protein
MGKTYRNNSENQKKQVRQKKKRKSRNSKQGYGNYRYDTEEETESRWDHYVAEDGIPFEKFSKRDRKR